MIMRLKEELLKIVVKLARVPFCFEIYGRKWEFEQKLAVLLLLID